MKKLLALLLAVMLVLPSVFVYAGEPESSEPVAEEVTAEDYAEYEEYDGYVDYGEYGPTALTVDVKLDVDVEAVKDVLKALGMPSYRISSMEPFLNLASGLEEKTIIADGGVQVDINLDDENAISLAGEFTEDGIVVGSTLFPNHILSVSMDTLMEMMGQYMPSGTSGTAAGEEVAEGDGSAEVADGEAASGEGTVQENPLLPYYQRMMESFMTNANPGEPELGEYEFEGQAFDTKTVVNVDAKAMAADERAIVNEMLDDQAILAMLNPALMPLQAYGLKVEDLKKINEDFMADEHIPNVTSTVYTSTENEDMFYVVNDSTFDGQEEPYQHFTMLYEDSSHANMHLTMPAVQLESSMEYDGNEMSFACDVAGMYTGFTVTLGNEDDPTITAKMYFLDKSRPLATATITILPEGERTLSLDKEGKKVIAVEEALTDGRILEDLLADVVSNGLNTVLNAAAKKVPSLENIFSAIFGTQAGESAGSAESFASSEASAA